MSHVPSLLRVFAALLCATLLAVTGLEAPIDRWVTDLGFRLRPAPSRPPPVTVVVLRGDSASATRPLRTELADFLTELARATAPLPPRAVVVDMNLSLEDCLSLAESSLPSERIIAATESLRNGAEESPDGSAPGSRPRGRVVHGMMMAPTALHGGTYGADLAWLEPFSFPDLPTFPAPEAQGMITAHPAFAARLYAAAGGVGFGNLSSAGDSRSLPLLFRYPTRSTSRPSRLYLALSLAGLEVALCGSEASPNCLYPSTDGIAILGPHGVRIPLDTKGEYRVNYRKRFGLVPPAPLTSQAPPDVTAATGLDVVLYHGQGASLPTGLLEAGPAAVLPVSSDWLTLPDGRTLVDLEALQQQVLLVVDGRERAEVETPLGRSYPLSTLHAQVMSNVLEGDFLHTLPRGFAWLAALALSVLAAVWHRFRPTYFTGLPLPMPPRAPRNPQARAAQAARALEGLFLPEVCGALLWAGLNIALLLANVVLPVALPLGTLAGSLLGGWLLLPRLLEREGVRAAALQRAHEEVLQSLEEKVTALSEARAQLDDLQQALSTDQVQEQASSELLAAWASVSDAELHALDDTLEQAERCLAQQNRTGEATAGVARGRKGPQAAEALWRERAALTELLARERTLRASLERHAAPLEGYRHWLQARQGAQQALLEELRRRIEALAERQRQVPVPRASSPVAAVVAQPPDEGLKPLHGMLTVDPELRRLLTVEVPRYARSDEPVLILGETGTGKELVFRAIYALSPLQGCPLCIRNCAAFAEGLIESELFGHVRGAFNNAVRDRKGAFREADGGTLFLDELGELPLAIQAKLLRAVQYGEVQPVGSDRTVKVKVRLVCATQVDLERAVSEGRFREDLYQRLKVAVIHLPPLRARRGDVRRLALHFASAEGRTLRLSEEALEEMGSYPWSGNVRELENLIHRLALLCEEGAVVDGAAVRQVLGPAPERPLRAEEPFTPSEREELEVFRRHGFRRGEVAAALEIGAISVDRHLRVLMARALWLADWRKDEAVRLLVGSDVQGLEPRVGQRLETFLSSLEARRLKDEGRDPTHAELKRQYRKDCEHIVRVLEALGRGKVKGEGERAESGES